MTEETIEKMISDWYLSTPRDINELSEQLLEQLHQLPDLVRAEVIYLPHTHTSRGER